MAAPLKRKVFYHVSRQLDPIEEFIPRIPESGTEEEDSITPRISVSTTLEGCFTAMPGGALNFKETNEERLGFYRLCRIDADELSIPAEAIYSSCYLAEEKTIVDAKHTGEHWITVPLKSVPSRLIHVSDWEEDTIRFRCNYKGNKRSYTLQRILNIVYSDQEETYQAYIKTKENKLEAAL